MTVLKETSTIKVVICDDFFKLPNKIETLKWVITKESGRNGYKSKTAREVG